MRTQTKSRQEERPMKIVLDTHAHTIVSGHAYNTIREMAQMAKEKGLEAFALTEHAPQMPGTCHEFYFQNLHIVPREMYGVRLFMGVELNIMNEKGEIDLPESTLCQMDIAIASIHGPCYKGERTEEAITAAYLAAMENPLIHIIGHPDDGRYPVDYEQLAKKAKETGTILEVNNGSLRPGGFRVDTRKNDLKMLEYCKKLFRLRVLLWISDFLLSLELVLIKILHRVLYWQFLWDYVFI